MKLRHALLGGSLAALTVVLSACGDPSETSTGSTATSSTSDAVASTTPPSSASTERTSETTVAASPNPQQFVVAVCDSLEIWASTPGPDDVEGDDPEGPPRASAARALGDALDRFAGGLPAAPEALTGTSEQVHRVVIDAAREYQAIAEGFDDHPESNAAEEIYAELVSRHHVAEEAVLTAVGQLLSAAIDEGADPSACPSAVLLAVPV
jgi:hypothetical protein